MKKKCLLVDDVDVSRYATSLIFEELDFDCLEAADETQCMDVLRAQKPDIILVDWHLRKASGLELISKIKALSGFSNVPVVVISGVEKSQKIQEAIQAGASDFLSKPATKVQIQAILKKLGLS